MSVVIAASQSSSSSSNQNLSILQEQQTQIFPYCLKLADNFLSKQLEIQKINFSSGVYPIDRVFKNLPMKSVVKANNAYKQGHLKNYRTALQEINVFSLSLILYSALTGLVFCSTTSKIRYVNMQVSCITIQDISFQNPVFQALPEKIKNMISRTLMYGGNHRVKDFIDEFSKQIRVYQLVISKPLELIDKYKRFVVVEGGIYYTRHATKIVISDEHHTSLLQQGLEKLKELPVGKIEKIELNPVSSLVLSKVPKIDRISSLIFYLSENTSGMSNSLSKISIGFKVTTGKPLILKSEQNNNGKISIEVNSLRNIHNTVRFINENENCVLFELYPEAFELKSKGLIISGIQSWPITFASDPNLMITDMCATNGLSYNIAYDDNLRIKCAEYANLDSKIHLLTREQAVLLNRSKSYYIERKITPNQYLKNKEEIFIKINELNVQLHNQYNEIVFEKQDFNLEVMRDRQKPFLRLCLYMTASLAVLHKISWIHGDIKAENIFIDKPFTLNHKPVLGDWYTSLLLLDPQVFPHFSHGEKLGVLEGCTESYVSEKCLDMFVESISENCRGKFNFACQMLDIFGMVTCFYQFLVGVRLPRSYLIKKNSMGEYRTCVVPHPSAFLDPVFLLLPQPIQNVMMRMINSDPTITLDEVYLTFKNAVYGEWQYP